MKALRLLIVAASFAQQPSTEEPPLAETPYEQATREHRPLLVFMDAKPAYSENWVTSVKDYKMPLPSILVYMPSPRGLEYVGWVPNIECAKFRIQEYRENRK